MTRSFMMTSRNETDTGFGIRKARLRYYSSDAAPGALTAKASWQELTAKNFTRALRQEIQNFPLVPDAHNEAQSHLSLFVHGYNNGWADSVQRYASIQSRLYAGPNSLGVLVLYSWPSDGSAAAYLPDREDARACAPDLADALVTLHDEIVLSQRAAAMSGKPDAERFCRAKVSVIAHSMGCFVMQKALAAASKRLNNPQLLTLLHQHVNVAADVDNDIFQNGQPLDSDGMLMSNLCYRIAALYSGLDPVLGASAGLKHFGKRRLGRSGLADRNKVPDNVFDIDVSPLIADTPGNKHSAVFESAAAMELVRRILVGTDRGHLGD